MAGKRRPLAAKAAWERDHNSRVGIQPVDNKKARKSIVLRSWRSGGDPWNPFKELE